MNIFQLFIQENMLKYRDYLQQSRAHKGQDGFPIHYDVSVQPQQHRSNQNIKELVSKPNYGQIFYSDEKKGKDANTYLRESLKIQRVRNEGLIKYMHQLEEQNAQLKAQLAYYMRQSAHSRHEEFRANEVPLMRTSVPQMQAAPQAQDQPYPGSNKNIPASQTIYTTGPAYQSAEGHEPNYTSFEPHQFQQTQQTYQSQLPQQTYQSLPQQSYQNLPQQSYPGQQQSYQQPYQQSHQQSYQPYSSQHQQSYQAQLPKSPTNAYNSQKSNNHALALKKINQIKDDDEELRQYTIALLKKQN